MRLHADYHSDAAKPRSARDDEDQCLLGVDHTKAIEEMATAIQTEEEILAEEIDARVEVHERRYEPTLHAMKQAALKLGFAASLIRWNLIEYAGNNSISRCIEQSNWTAQAEHIVNDRDSLEMLRRQLSQQHFMQEIGEAIDQLERAWFDCRIQCNGVPSQRQVNYCTSGQAREKERKMLAKEELNSR